MQHPNDHGGTSADSSEETLGELLREDLNLVDAYLDSISDDTVERWLNELLVAAGYQPTAAPSGSLPTTRPTRFCTAARGGRWR
jgi:hypothetical protein